jgi:alpha-glucosidase
MAADPRSILTLYRRLIALRREQVALHAGAYAGAQAEGDVLAFERRHGPDARLLVALNLGHASQSARLPADAAEGRLLLSTWLDREGEAVRGALTLRPAEGVILDFSPR